MSWTSRLGSLGRFSPFGRSPTAGSSKVSDADFSYITADDLRRHQAESLQHTDEDLGPPRDTDVLVLRNKKQEAQVHFPAYSIAKGELTIGQVRDHAARKYSNGDARRIKLLYRGKNLKDDSRTCREEELRDRAELLVTVPEGRGLSSPSESDDDDDNDDDDASFDGASGRAGTGEEAKRRRNRGKKTKRRNKREEQNNASNASSLHPGGLGVGGTSSAQSSRGQSPRPPPSPATPLDKLEALYQTLQQYVPDCRAFMASPPSDPAKKEFEHKRLSETIMTQVLLKLDAIETEGDTDARTRRKELVKETQSILQELDAVMK